MELKESDVKPLEYKHEDVKFLVKPEATEEDRLEVLLAGRQDGENIVMSRAEYCKTVIRRMVVGWEGVTRKGEAVPYSFEELRNFPRGTGKNVLLELGGYIIEHTDIAKPKNPNLKKG